MTIEQVRNVIDEARREAALRTASAEQCINEKNYDQAVQNFRTAVSAQKVALQTAADFLAPQPPKK
jgi:hypothetical protein